MKTTTIKGYVLIWSDDNKLDTDTIEFDDALPFFKRRSDALSHAEDAGEFDKYDGTDLCRLVPQKVEITIKAIK